MAGESPDRSKQRESSAEATSGSAGAVPDSREPRDPRIAVARESESSASTSRGGVDTATRVFSVRELEIERDADDSSGSAEGADGETGESTDEAAEETNEGATEGATEGVTAWPR